MLAAARCKQGATLPVGAAEVDFGEAAPTPDGFALGLTRVDGGKRIASVVLVAAGLKSLSFVDVGPSLGDAPPPLPFVVGKQLFAAGYVPVTDAGTPHTRPLGVFRLDAGHATRVATIDQRSDDSPAFDVAVGTGGVLFAWDEDAPSLDHTGDHGLIRIARLEGTQSIVDVGVASPGTTDADEPQLAHRRGGWWLAWIARRPERTDAGETVVALEGPAQDRDYRWIELLALDESGQPAGSPHALTATQGHVGVFTLVGGNGKDESTLDVIARDDQQATDGSGGRILRVAVHAEGADPPIVMVAEEAGHGVPVLLTSGASAWLSYTDTGDHARLLPLGPGLATGVASSSVEPALDDARLLGVKDPSGPSSWIAVRQPASLMSVACTP